MASDGRTGAVSRAACVAGLLLLGATSAAGDVAVVRDSVRAVPAPGASAASPTGDVPDVAAEPHSSGADAGVHAAPGTGHDHVEHHVSGADGHGAGKGAGHGDAHGASLTVYWINFLAYCGLLWFFLRKPLSALWSARRAAVKDAMATARADRLAAADRLAELTRRDAVLPEELENLARTAELEAEREATAVRRAAEARADTLTRQASATMKAEAGGAMRRLEESLVAAVVERASEIARTRHDASADRGARDRAARVLVGKL